ncbi:V-ATPase V1 sector subunit E [Pleurotus pulmonarius]|nr:V-ATPase V1 sector subunit E [Pleurotus pulmonarius]
MVVWLLSSALADILITVSLVAFLHPRKTGFPSTDRLLARIIRLAIQSGMATTACALTEGILVLAQSRFRLAFYLIPEFMLSKLYVNSIFATLNARERWHGLLRDDRPTSFLQFNSNDTHHGSETSPIDHYSPETLEAGVDFGEIREEIRNPASGVVLNPVVRKLWDSWCQMPEHFLPLHKDDIKFRQILPMNDDEVLSEMNKMVAFIKQEALEKAREIRVKADEEFAIEKAKLVKQEQQAIDALYDKKLKGVDVSQKIAQSTLTNRSRLKLLHRREEHLQDLFDSARSQISTLASDKGRYVQFLEGIIVQGFLQLMESEVTIETRKKDAEEVTQAAEAAAATYKDLSGKDIKFDVSGVLNDNGAGGIRLINASGRITIDNTLDERLRLLEDRMLPEIRRDLFGANENRKFYT